MMFVCASNDDVGADKQGHMHDMALSMVDKDTMVQRWTMFLGGEEHSQDMRLTRVE